MTNSKKDKSWKHENCATEMRPKEVGGQTIHGTWCKTHNEWIISVPNATPEV